MAMIERILVSLGRSRESAEERLIDDVSVRKE